MPVMNNKQKNYFLSKCLIKAYGELGVKYAFVSPGSRNTPLMLALSDQTKIKAISYYQNIYFSSE